MEISHPVSQRSRQNQWLHFPTGFWGFRRRLILSGSWGTRWSCEGRRKPQPATLISNSRCYCKASQGNPCIIFPYELEIPHQKTQMLKVQKDGTKNWGGASSQRPEATYLPTEQNQTTLQVTGWRHVKQVHRWVPLREVQFNPLEGQLCCTPEVRWAAQTHSPQQKELMASKGFMPGVVSDSTQLLKGRTYSY